MKKAAAGAKRHKPSFGLSKFFFLFEVISQLLTLVLFRTTRTLPQVHNNSIRRRWRRGDIRPGGSRCIRISSFKFVFFFPHNDDEDRGSRWHVLSPRYFFFTLTLLTNKENDIYNSNPDHDIGNNTNGTRKWGTGDGEGDYDGGRGSRYILFLFLLNFTNDILSSAIPAIPSPIDHHHDFLRLSTCLPWPHHHHHHYHHLHHQHGYCGPNTCTPVSGTATDVVSFTAVCMPRRWSTRGCVASPLSARWSPVRRTFRRLRLEGEGHCSAWHIRVHFILFRQCSASHTNNSHISK